MKLLVRRPEVKEAHTLFGEIHYKRMGLKPADNRSMNRLSELTGDKGIYPLDLALKLQHMPFHLSPALTARIASIAVRNRCAFAEPAGLRESYGLDTNLSQTERFVFYAGMAAFWALKERQEMQGNGMLQPAGTLWIVFRVFRFNNMKAGRESKSVPDTGAYICASVFSDGDMETLTDSTGNVRAYRVLHRQTAALVTDSAGDLFPYIRSYTERYSLTDSSRVVIVADIGICSEVQSLADKYEHAQVAADIDSVKEYLSGIAEAAVRESGRKEYLKQELYGLLEQGAVCDIPEKLLWGRSVKELGAFRWMSDNPEAVDYPSLRRNGVYVGTGPDDCSDRPVLGKQFGIMQKSISAEAAQALISLIALADSGRLHELTRILEECDLTFKGSTEGMRKKRV